MKLEKKPVMNTTADEVGLKDSSDSDDACLDMKSASPLPKEVLSSSLSSLDDSDNDSGFIGVSRGSLNRLDTVTPDVNNEINKLVAEDKLEVNGIYNRDAIILNLTTHDDSKQLELIVGKIEEAQRLLDKKTNPQTCDKNGQIPVEQSQKSRFERLRDAATEIPDSMLHLVVGVKYSGDCGRSSDEKPDWLDMEKLKRGQKFAQDHMFSVCFAQMLSLFALFSFEDGLQPLIITAKSSTPYAAFKRYLSTTLRVWNWHTEDPWEKGSNAYKDILAVRAMHAAVKRKLDNSTNAELDEASIIPNAWCPSREMLLKDFQETCPEPTPGQCPYRMQKNTPNRPKGMNQLEMAVTQWGFIGLLISYPKALGVHYASDEDLEAFCHLWRSIGYQLGMKDEFNFCRGTLEQVRQRSRDYIETWVKPNFRLITPEWEHMMRCMFVGSSCFLPGAQFESALLFLTETINLEMPRLYASLSYTDWISYNLLKSLFRYTIRLPGVFSMLNKSMRRGLDRAENFTQEDHEMIKIKLTNHPANYKRPDASLLGMDA